MTSGVMNVRDLMLLIIGIFTTFVDSTFHEMAQTFLRTARKAVVLFSAESRKLCSQELPPNSSKGQRFCMMQITSELKARCVSNNS